MGIRFFCPNGHRLNVKAELAGKIGYCPTCHARMAIPLESTREHGERFPGQKKGTGVHTPPDGGTSEGVAVLPASVSDAPSKENLEASRIPMSAIIREVTAPSSHFAKEESGDPSLMSPDKIVASLNDPSILWYVSSPDGGNQYGPTSGATIQDWIHQRRISPKMYVWRQGWKDWQEAEKVFPAVRQIFENSGEELQHKESDIEVLETLRLPEKITGEENVTRRYKKATKSFVIICSLIGLVAVLLAVLIYILCQK